MSEHKYLPRQNSITLGPTDDEDIWELTFVDEQSGEEIRIVLPVEQLEEMDAEFTGLDHVF